MVNEKKLLFDFVDGGIAGYFDMHTPLGALGIGAAAGGVLVVASEPDATDLSPILGLRVRYTVFLTKKIFLKSRLRMTKCG